MMTVHDNQDVERSTKDKTAASVLIKITLVFFYSGFLDIHQTKCSQKLLHIFWFHYSSREHLKTVEKSKQKLKGVTHTKLCMILDEVVVFILRLYTFF